MCLIQNKGVRIAVNREADMETVISQLQELSGQQLGMVSDYIRGLKAAETYLKRT